MVFHTKECSHITPAGEYYLQLFESLKCTKMPKLPNPPKSLADKN